jgi:hypothetical protein
LAPLECSGLVHSRNLPPPQNTLLNIRVVGQFQPEARSNNQRLVVECHLLGCRYLEYLGPSGQCISFNGWLLQASALNPVEEDIRRRREIMQLDGSAQGSCSESQGIPLGPSPGAPFDDYRKTEREEFLTELPLERLDLPAPFFIVDVE